MNSSEFNQTPNPDLFRRIFDLHPSAISVYDKTGKMIYANKSAAAMGAWGDSQELMGTPRPDVVKRNVVKDEEGNPIPIEEYSTRLAEKGIETKNRIVMQMNTVDRKWRWLSISSTPLFDDEGKVEYVVTIVEDVTVQKSKEDKLRFLIESAKILSLTMDFYERLHQKAKLTVPSLADWCGIDLVNQNGSHTRVVTVHKDPKQIEFLKELNERYPEQPDAPSGIGHVIKTGVGEFYPSITDELIDTSTREGEAEAIRQLRLSSLMVIPIKSRGRVLGALSLAYAESGRIYNEEDFEFMKEFGHHLGVLLDNARLFEEIHTRDKAKDLFLATLSHELRNPLAPIKTSLEILRLRKESALFGAELEIIDRQFDHMSRLLHDLLDATRFTQGRISLEREFIELQDLINHVVSSNSGVIQKKGIELKVSLPQEQVWIWGDVVRLEQALTNILQNAQKFTPEGGRITISATKEDNIVALSIRDNGIGIEPENLEKIFDLYFQGEHPTQRKNGGLGIGLLLVREIVELHGGSIKAASEGLNKGSEFIIQLSAVTPKQGQHKSGNNTDIQKTMGDHENTRKKILVIDDNYDAADSLAKLLNALDTETRAVYSGQQALATLKHFTPDLIFLDLTMPLMDGFEALHEIRKNGFSETPVFALSGHGLKTDEDRVLNSGFTELLAKPIGMEELRNLLQKY